MKILKIIQKDLKLLLRSRTSALIVILGPLLLILLVGTAFNNAQTYSIGIGYYSSNYNELTESFVQKLEDKQFKTVKFDSEETCVQAILQGRVHTCIVFPADISIENGKSNNIIFHVDYSKINLVYMVTETLSTGMSERSEEITSNLTSILIEKLDNTQRRIQTEGQTIIALTDQNMQLSVKNTKLQSDLMALDLAMDPNAFKMEDLSSKTEGMVKRVSQLRGTAGTKITETQDKLTSTKTKVEDLDANATKEDEINDAIDQAIGILGNLSVQLGSAKTETDQDWTEIKDLLANAEVKINEAKNKLDKASNFKTSSSTELDEIKTLLSESLNNIIKLKTAMNDITNDINSIQVTDVENIVNPITTTIKPVISEKTHLNYLFPGLIVLVVMFVSILLSATVVMTEKKSSAYFRNYITPTNDLSFFFGNFLTNFIVMIVQLGIIIGVAVWYFKTSFTVASLLATIVILMLVVTVFILLGMGIGYFFNTEQTATLGAISVGSIFLLLSDLILPIESMPDYAIRAAQYNPFVIAQNLLKKTILFQSPLMPLRNDIYILAAYAIGLFILILIFQKFMRKYYFIKLGIFRPKRPKKGDNEKIKQEKEIKKPKNQKDEEHVLSL